MRNNFLDYTDCKLESEYDMKMRIQLAIFNEFRSKMKKEEEEPVKINQVLKPIKKRKKNQGNSHNIANRPGSVTNQNQHASGRKNKPAKSSNKN